MTSCRTGQIPVVTLHTYSIWLKISMPIAEMYACTCDGDVIPAFFYRLLQDTCGGGVTVYKTSGKVIYEFCPKNQLNV
jgi:hypothetical protein